MNPIWIDELDNLVNGQRGYMTEIELSFWHETIKNHLTPITRSESQKQDIIQQLKQLRNKSCTAFLMLNLFWIVLQYKFEYVAISVDEYIKRFTSSFQTSVGHHKVQILGLIYMSCFVVTLCLQFFGMILHRWSTLLDILINVQNGQSDYNRDSFSSEGSSIGVSVRYEEADDVWKHFSLFEEVGEQ
ncbi:hypothetical protein ACOME3_009979 [Neoechinorhynchus agilis]